MTNPNKSEEGDRRKSARRVTEDRRSATRAVAGDRREVEQRGMAEAMVDALEDILKWERASERALRTATVASSSDLTN